MEVAEQTGVPMSAFDNPLTSAQASDALLSVILDFFVVTSFLSNPLFLLFFLTLGSLSIVRTLLISHRISGRIFLRRLLRALLITVVGVCVWFYASQVMAPRAHGPGAVTFPT